MSAHVSKDRRKALASECIADGTDLHDALQRCLVLSPYSLGTRLVQPSLRTRLYGHVHAHVHAHERARARGGRAAGGYARAI